jgi:putative FmdB family regulatory protein
MPTYDYQCEACGHEFEKFQSITARAIKTCPECGQRKVRRLIGTGAGVIFRGSGFYQTDYRSESYKRDASKAKGSGDSSSSKSDSSSSTSKSSEAKASASSTKTDAAD